MPATGGRHTADAKERIGKAQAARLKAAREFGEPPKRKRCTQCNKIKDVPGDFHMKRRKLTGGDYSIHPSSECKACANKRMTRWRASKTQDELREYWRRADKNRKAKHKRQAHIRLDPAPFYDWCQRFKPELSDDEQHALRRIKSGEQKTVDLDFVDRIMTGEGYPDQVAVLYPMEDQT